MTKIVTQLIVIPLLLAVFLSSTKCYKNPVEKITLAEFLYRRLHKFGRNNRSEKQVKSAAASAMTSSWSCSYLKHTTLQQ